MFPSRQLAAMAVCTAAALAASRAAFGFALMGDSWPAGTDIVMHLSLSRTFSGLQDGSTSWNASAADALQIWNQHLQTVRFVQGGSVASGNGDGRNSVFFSNSIYGDSFGDRVIAVTVGFNDASDQTVIAETDVIFNNTEQWNSYRGAQQYDSRGNPIFDLHRVALHEFGHVLGLDHPDAKGQTVHALMNSTTDDNDSITADDIAGAQHLYGTSSFRVPLGGDFQHQPRGSAGATNFSAKGLPPGLTIDYATGLISGVPNISGTFAVTVDGISSSGAVSLQLTIVVFVPPMEPPASGRVEYLKTIPISATRFLADPARSRIYASSHYQNIVSVIDTHSFTVVSTIAVENGPAGLSISPDNSRLFVGRVSGSGIAVIDLHTLGRLPDLPGTYGLADVASGDHGRLYVSSSTSAYQVDDRTGAVTANLSGTWGMLRLSADRRWLYNVTNSTDTSLRKYDISSAVPALVKDRPWISGWNTRDFAVGADGSFLALAGRYSGQAATAILSTSDLSSANSGFAPPDAANPQTQCGIIALSGDGRVAYQSLTWSSKVVSFEPKSLAPLGQIALPKLYYETSSVGTDSSGAYLLIAAHNMTSSTSGQFPMQGEIAVYTTGRINSPVVEQPRPKGLSNVSTRMRVATGENVLIGGFIVQGETAKRVIVRAVGPSLGLTGTLADPILELHDSSGGVVDTNDNWNSHRKAVLNSGVAPSNEYEAALVASLSPGAYTAVVRGNSGAQGVALVEVYDLEPDRSRIANISTRGRVETGDAVMIGGFIISGDHALPVIIRALGPSLSSGGVEAALADTTLDLHDGNGSLMASNDDWRRDQEQAVVASTVAPTDDRESAIVKTLAPGNYTAIVRGKNDTTGVALVEVYNLEPH